LLRQLVSMAAPGFTVPEVVDNADGWGPSVVPFHLNEVPFAPFSKADKLGKASDWTGQGYQRFRDRQNQQGSNAVFSFFHADEEDSFHLVDSRPVRPQQFKPRRFQPRFNQRRDRNAPEEPGAKKDGTKQPANKVQPKKKQQWGYFQRYDNRQPVYSCSVDVRPEWTVHEQIQFATLSKLNMTVGEPTDVAASGSLGVYDKVLDRLTAKMEKKLEKTKRVFRNVTTSEDPIIKRLAEGKTPVAQVFATDAILSALMTAPRSVYSWDLVITRSGDKLFFDKRDGSNLDRCTVHETAPDPIPEDKDSINAVQQLSVEATAINQNFSQQVLDDRLPKMSLGEAVPFLEAGETPPSVGYKYRKWKLSEGCHIVVRCQLDAVTELKGEKQMCCVKALTEFDPKLTINWRKKLEAQRGAVLATEVKNNTNQMARWTASAIMAGADLIKLGYVSRTMPKLNSSHVILGTQQCKPKDLAQQMNLNMNNAWGIVRAVVDVCLKLGEGKYLMVKDPNKQLLRLYEIPEDAFKTDYSEEPMVSTDEAPPPQAPQRAKEDDI